MTWMVIGSGNVDIRIYKRISCLGMSSLAFSGFDWDDGNRQKCQKHGLSIPLIERFFRDDTIYVAPDLKHSQSEQRYLAIGLIEQRGVFVAFTFRVTDSETLIRPISARYMHKREWQKYEQAFTNNQQ